MMGLTTFLIKTIVFFACFFLVIGCSPGESYVMRSHTSKCVSERDRDKLAAFIVECAKAANPLSDEEGEDLVEQCERSGINSVCPTTEICQEVERKPGFMEHANYKGWGPCKP